MARPTALEKVVPGVVSVPLKATAVPGANVGLPIEPRSLVTVWPGANFRLLNGIVLPTPPVPWMKLVAFTLTLQAKLSISVLTYAISPTAIAALVWPAEMFPKLTESWTALIERTPGSTGTVTPIV